MALEHWTTVGWLGRHHWLKQVLRTHTIMAFFHQLTTRCFIITPSFSHKMVENFANVIIRIFTIIIMHHLILLWMNLKMYQLRTIFLRQNYILISPFLLEYCLLWDLLDVLYKTYWKKLKGFNNALFWTSPFCAFLVRPNPCKNVLGFIYKIWKKSQQNNILMVHILKIMYEISIDLVL